MIHRFSILLKSEIYSKMSYKLFMHSTNLKNLRFFSKNKLTLVKSWEFVEKLCIMQTFSRNVNWRYSTKKFLRKIFKILNKVTVCRPATSV